jgi:hypothetical protein
MLTSHVYETLNPTITITVDASTPGNITVRCPGNVSPATLEETDIAAGKV